MKRIRTTRKEDNAIHTLQDLNYEYDKVGNIIKQTDKAQQTEYYDNQKIEPVLKYKYDALYRMVEATGRELAGLVIVGGEDFQKDLYYSNPPANSMRNYTHHYEYDVLGNIKNDGWKTYEYATVNNYLLGHDGLENQYSYDKHGNISSMPHLSEMRWDYLDQLHSTTNKTFISYYSYDSEGSRTRKITEKTNIREEKYYICGYEVFRKYCSDSLKTECKSLSIYDLKKQEKEQDKESSIIGYNGVFEKNQRIALIETLTVDDYKEKYHRTVRYQYSNHLGSACLELDEDGLIISYEEYHPFGTTSYRAGRSKTEVSLKRYRYNGKEKDEETELYYYGARYLCPMVM